MDTLTQAFYDVMYKYEKNFSEQGVKANLDAWWENKSGLLTLLRNHPNWNEQELAIVFDLSEGREIDHDVVDESKFYLQELVNEVDMMPEQRSAFEAALQAATAEYSKLPSEAYIQVIQEQGGIKCAVGQKASRIINKLCQQFGVDRHPRYNSVFARLADSLNPIQIQKTGVLSIHPCDFLEMSNRNNDWTSCHCLEAGSYQAGCLSYMTDSTSMIFMAVDENVRSDFHKAPRLAREIFCYSDKVLLQSRLYPTDNDEQRKLYRGLVQKAMADCLGVPNLWSVQKNQEQVNEYLETAAESKQYRDYEHGYGILSVLKDAEDTGKIVIGSLALCVCCGQSLTRNGRIKCDCVNLVVCQDCGETVPTSEARYLAGAYHCRSCLHICAACGQMIHGEIFPAFNRHGNPVQICPACHEAQLAPCQICGVRNACSVIGGRFCQRTTIAA